MEKDESFEAFLEMLNSKLERQRVQIINPKRVAEMQSAYNALCAIVKRISPDANLDCMMHEMNIGAGVIRIETDELIVENIPEFVKSIENASNFEIYPLKGGKIKIAIMFYGCLQELS